MRRKSAPGTPTPLAKPARAPRALTESTFRLPTLAALVSAMAALTVTPPAGAVIAAAPADAAVVPTDATTDGAADDEVDASGETLDAYIAPVVDVPPLGGVPPPTRIRGTGCGCGSEGNDQSTASAITGMTALGLALSRPLRRRRRGCSPTGADPRRSTPDRSR